MHEPDEPQDGARPSRLTQHLELMGLASPRSSPEELAAERRLLAEMHPLALKLPKGSDLPVRRRPWLAPALALAAVAALVTLVVHPWRREPDARVTVKGATTSRLYVETNGERRLWEPGSKAVAGARLAAEVTAGVDTVAFWAATDRGGKALTSPAWIAGHELRVAAGGRGTLPGSLVLDADDVGEVLTVVTCPAADLTATPPAEAADQVAAAAAAGVLPASGPLAGCQLARYPLRGG